MSEPITWMGLPRWEDVSIPIEVEQLDDIEEVYVLNESDFILFEEGE
jgi:hypothetical protein